MALPTPGRREALRWFRREAAARGLVGPFTRPRDLAVGIHDLVAAGTELAATTHGTPLDIVGERALATLDWSRITVNDSTHAPALPRHDHVTGGRTKRKGSILRVEGVTVERWLGFSIVRGAHGTVADLSGYGWPLTLTPIAAHHPLAGAPSRRVRRALLVGDEVDYQNFCHLLLDIVIQVELLALAGDGAAVLMPDISDTRFGAELLELLRAHHPNTEFIALTHGDVIAVDELFGLRQDPLRGSHPAFLGAEWARRYLRELISPPQVRRPGLVWIGRHRRRVLNAPELIAALRRSGREVTLLERPETLTLREQASLFLAHEHVMGMHGAGLSWLALTEGTPHRVTEIQAHGNGTLAFAVLSAAVGADHGLFMAPALKTEHPNHPDCVVDPSDFLEFIASTSVRD
jgi:capsular polysaccharide biosynthesis protein